MGVVSLGLMLMGFGMWTFSPKQTAVIEPITFFLEMGDQGEASGLVAVEHGLRPRQFELRGVVAATPIVDAVTMQVKVQDQTNGQVLYQAEQKLLLDGKGQFASFRAEFVPRNQGEHLLTVKVGKPVRAIQVTVDR